MIKNYYTYIKESTEELHAGDAIEIIGPFKDSIFVERGWLNSSHIGLKGIIIPNSNTFKEAEYETYHGEKIYNIKTRWPDLDGSLYDFWQDQKSKDKIHQQYQKTNGREINPMIWWTEEIPGQFLKKINKEEYLQELDEYEKNIKEKLKDKKIKKALIADKMKDVDPYGEEEWDD